MYSFRSLPLALILLITLVVGAFSSPTEQRRNGDPSAFQELLSTASEQDLHDILHRYDSRFRDGVFHRDRTALEAVHGEDPATATELVKLALKKRQISNTTSSVPPTVSSSTTAGTPTRTSTSDDKTSVIPPSSPTGASAISSTSGAVIYSNSDGQLTTAHPSTALFRPTTTTLRKTTTLPDGTVSVITSVEVVDAAYTTLSSPAAVESGTSTNEPSLQTGSAPPSSGCLELMMGAIAGLAVIAIAM